MIHTEELTKVYPGDIRAVIDLNLDVNEGEIFGLLGPNGAGKTTTVGMLTTRVIPTEGRASLAGVDVVAHPSEAKRLIGVVSQTNTLDRSLSVWENLYYHGRYFGMGAKASSPAPAIWRTAGRSPSSSQRPARRCTVGSAPSRDGWTTGCVRT